MKQTGFTLTIMLAKCFMSSLSMKKEKKTILNQKKNIKDIPALCKRKTKMIICLEGFFKAEVRR